MFKFVVAIVFLVCLIANNVESQKVLKKTCGPDKLIPGKEFDAVREALEIVRKESIGSVYSSTVGGNKVWAQGKCLTKGDCRPCINKLIDNVWALCDNSKSLELKSKRCSLKYDFFEF